ncbi:MAG: hypothetical protein GY804_09010 [Alphaproteobacteria bacterium]|nr:hypothetical protein [Alphaproteobacteria bacterium]
MAINVSDQEMAKLAELDVQRGSQNQQILDNETEIATLETTVTTTISDTETKIDGLTNNISSSILTNVSLNDSISTHDQRHEEFKAAVDSGSVNTEGKYNTEELTMFGSAEYFYPLPFTFDKTKLKELVIYRAAEWDVSVFEMLGLAPNGLNILITGNGGCATDNTNITYNCKDKYEVGARCIVGMSPKLWSTLYSDSGYMNPHTGGCYLRGGIKYGFCCNDQVLLDAIKSHITTGDTDNWNWEEYTATKIEDSQLETILNPINDPIIDLNYLEGRFGEEPLSGGDIGLAVGGHSEDGTFSSAIQKIQLSTTAACTILGNLPVSVLGVSAMSNGINDIAISTGGHINNTTINNMACRYHISTNNDAVHYATMADGNVPYSYRAYGSNAIGDIGIAAGGQLGSGGAISQYIYKGIISTGTQFNNTEKLIPVSLNAATGVTNSIESIMLVVGGTAGGTILTTIQKIVISTNTDGVLFGNITEARYFTGGGSYVDIAIIPGGYADSNVIISSSGEITISNGSSILRPDQLMQGITQGAVSDNDDGIAKLMGGWDNAITLNVQQLMVGTGQKAVYSGGLKEHKNRAGGVSNA